MNCESILTITDFFDSLRYAANAACLFLALSPYLISLPQWQQKLSFALTLQPQRSQRVPSCVPQQEQYRCSTLCAAPQTGQSVMLRL